MDGGWDPQADWEAQLKAARAAQAAWEAETGQTTACFSIQTAMNDSTAKV